ncbi:MAG: hypothetical protein A3B91_02920 [Candidatus Yanofskybacteria bacterium RIFCSPHIGHO2_02_FULL_41_29]|uniref:Methyltransferase domain-containing protein n=1 Tax=Candidatus Yanofskybacteria bacterium RIFCSPHIGHO2_01_FULL_41_53 TaxID=1802663 RepID=A0A1F8EL32_9BACT|nr:MAG: hypothetical protein A2650_02270 [Candidatus Yanofskybacteria bacterium RIFCSPHIGHO2_01_FULL_41_53]OGN12216.1 MAG: hypothetical protein A3B91_02920 [Candidatus Yanofskybacteria bacterium RIFCSPHIGHO2_02_FULL_41_29]OGN18958.1 MAG: hypothetical protein A3F48_03865 [Candidatus Yanofskybacteria bacterium RIFCSPHIGHO2_12_FULL_41_9]OGN23830.1 MAG: hypothetical protein A2916_01200 [Candidatus Yanofskybacteria bacterium RIFCSPLOWO2_01_FULL_41_67]OGN28566.1 MAG: hypothetical protein A3H54_04905 
MNNRELFRGAAWYYAKYRRGYPDAFFKHIIKSFNLDKTFRVLDLGTGTGQIAIPLARYVREVVAVDPEQEMLDEGRSQAEKSGIKNISWLLSRAEDITKELGAFRLTTMGASFHWMEQDKVLEKVFEITEEGGGIAIISNNSPVLTDKGDDRYKTVVAETIKKYLGEKRRAGNSFYQEPKERFEVIIQRSKFQGFEIFSNKYQQRWTTDEIIGFLSSTSYASRRLFGERIDEFEKELRDKLLKLNPSGFFTETVVSEAYLAWK